jgi:replication factor C subunit 2/4
MGNNQLNGACMSGPLDSTRTAITSQDKEPVSLLTSNTNSIKTASLLMSNANSIKMAAEAEDIKSGRGVPWSDRYRPVGLGSVVGSEEALKRLRLIALNGNMPHMLLAGPPGTGKTTSALCLAQTLLGSNASEGLLELNASDTRGIEVVRTKVKAFAQKKLTLPANRHKIVILDEADAMTSSAQQGLRRLMDKHILTTRFVLACNTMSKIADCVQSRCVAIRFSRVSDDAMRTRLRHIALAERVHMHKEDGLDALIFSAHGDLRLAINTLQAVASGLGDLNAENVYRIADQPQPLAAASIIRRCMAGDTIAACTEMSVLNRQGHNPVDVLTTLLRVSKHLPDLDSNPHLRITFADIIGLAYVRAADGLYSFLQLNGLIANLSIASSNTSISLPTPPQQIH